MRNLTITRTKCFVASLMKVKVYIEDPASPEIIISDVPCRKIGELKNGETATFPIGNEAAKVFVIADNSSSSYCNDFYSLPAGEEDITLTGKNHYAPSVGNPFRFDGNDNPEAIANRKKAQKKRSFIIIGAILLGIAISLFSYRYYFQEMTAEPEDFTYREMTITLTNNFEKSTENVNYDMYYESPKVLVGIIRTDLDTTVGLQNISLEEYGDMLEASAKSELNVTTDGFEEKDGILMMEFAEKIGTEKYNHTWCIFKSDNALWVIEFTTFEEEKNRYYDDIEKYAKSVTFSDKNLD